MREMIQVKVMISNQGETLTSEKELITLRRIHSLVLISVIVNTQNISHPPKIQFKIS
jgi:hypothetical protein